MSEHIRKRHNVTLLIYHIVLPAKYRKKIFTEQVENYLKEVCIEISQRYEINFIEIGSDLDHIHFLVQSIPDISVSELVKIIKSITAKQIFKKYPDLKKELWGGSLWTAGYYANTVGKYTSEETIKAYVKNQGKTYKTLYKNQMKLFE